VNKAGETLRGNASHPQVQRFLADVLNQVGSGSQPGEGSKTKLERFLLEAQTYVDWWAASQSSKGKPAVLPLGEETAAAWRLYRDLRPKIDQYFALTDAVQIDPSLGAELWPWPTDRETLDFSSAEAVQANLRDAPLALPDAQGTVDPDGRLNPFYAVQFRRLLQVVPDSRGEFPGFDRSDWEQIQLLFAPYEAWLAAKPETPMADLGSSILKRYIEEGSREEVQALIARGRDTTLVLDSVRLLERLILFQAWLLPFVNSFVSFPDLYDPQRRALFEMGTLVIDGRHLDLSVRVLDRERHAKISDSSNMFVLYTKVLSHKGEELYEVAVPVTAGGRGTLQLYKRGIFIDVEGREYDAVIAQIVENPISLSEAMTAPFKLLGATITGRIEKITEKAQEKLKETGSEAVGWIGQPIKAGQDTAGQEGVSAQATAARGSKATAPTPSAAPSKAGLLAGGGIAIAALGSSLAFIINTLASLDLKTILSGLAAALLGILVPVTIVAVLKLSKRDLSAILEGSGWAINARMHLTRRQAKSFTWSPPFPAGSKGIRHRSWWFWILLALAVMSGLYFLRR